MLRRMIASALLSALLVHGAATSTRADESEAAVGVPLPEQSSEAAAPPPESAAPAQPTAEPGPNLATEPIEALQRPKGVWGGVAIAADVLVMRPIGLLSLVPGAAAFVLVSPVRAATGGLGDSLDALHERTKNVFSRPLGSL